MGNRIKASVLCMAALIFGLFGCQRSETPKLESSRASMAQVTADIAKDTATVPEITENGNRPGIFVMEERHTSVAVQMEIAIMLLRLHDKYGLRDVALEGFVPGKGNLDQGWFHKLGDSKDKFSRDQVALQLLRKGEISGVEFAALVLPDIKVHPADDRELYDVNLTNLAEAATTLYLFKIAATSLREEQVPKLKELKEANKTAELIQYIISSDPWAKAKYEGIKAHGSGQSIEEWLKLLAEIEKKAQDAKAPLDQQDREAMEGLRKFYKAASERSQVLARTAEKIARQGAGQICALIIGAAHTPGIKKLLKQSDLNFSVLRPLGMESEKGDMDLSAYERKTKSLSVEDAGAGLGSLLDRRHKPPPVADEPWFKADSEIRFATVLIAQAAASGDFPSPDLRRKLDALNFVKINWGQTRKTKDGAVIIQAGVSMGGPVIQVWGKAAAVDPAKQAIRSEGKTLEQLLLEYLQELRKEDASKKIPPKKPSVEWITSGVSAAFARDKATVEAIAVTPG